MQSGPSVAVQSHPSAALAIASLMSGRHHMLCIYTIATCGRQEDPCDVNQSHPSAKNKKSLPVEGKAVHLVWFRVMHKLPLHLPHECREGITFWRYTYMYIPKGGKSKRNIAVCGRQGGPSVVDQGHRSAALVLASLTFERRHTLYIYIYISTEGRKRKKENPYLWKARRSLRCG